jgi:hypothetical protein
MAAVGSRWLVSTAAVWSIPKDAVSSTNFIGGTWVGVRVKVIRFSILEQCEHRHV